MISFQYSGKADGRELTTETARLIETRCPENPVACQGIVDRIRPHEPIPPIPHPIFMNAPVLKPGQSVVFEGDSMTRRSMMPSSDNWPLLRMNNWHRSYAELVEEWIFAHRPDLNIKCRHAAIGGSAVTDLHARYETQVKPQRPGWIIFTIGSNDCARGCSPADFESGLARYIEAAQRDSGARFLYAGDFEPMPGLAEESREHVARAKPYFEIARRLVIGSGGLAPGIGAALRAKAELHFAQSNFHSYYGDGVHLGALGNHVLAGLVLEALGVFTPAN